MPTTTTTTLLTLLVVLMLPRPGAASLHFEACLLEPHDALKETSFEWRTELIGHQLAERTVYRSTSSWDAREVLLFSPSDDETLRTFLDDIKHKADIDELDEEARIQLCLDRTREVLGLSGNGGGAKRELDAPLAPGGSVIQLGRYLQEQQGVCRHGAFLLKAALDVVGLPGKSVMWRGTHAGPPVSRHVWVVYNDTLALDASWYDKAMALDTHLANGLTSDANPVVLGTCGKPWQMATSDDEQCSMDGCVAPNGPERLAELQGMRVRDLRRLLASHARTCTGCVEKNEFVAEAMKIPAGEKPKFTSFAEQDNQKAKADKTKTDTAKTDKTKTDKTKTDKTKTKAKAKTQSSKSGGKQADEEATVVYAVSWPTWMILVVLGEAAVIGLLGCGLWVMYLLYTKQRSELPEGLLKHLHAAGCKIHDPISATTEKYVVVSGRVGNCAFINGRYQLLSDCTLNDRPVYFKLRDPHVADDQSLAIWCSNNIWYIGLPAEMGQTRGFASLNQNPPTPQEATVPWMVGDGLRFVADHAILCQSVVVERPNGDDPVELEGQIRREVQAAQAQATEQAVAGMLQLSGTPPTAVFVHHYNFDHGVGPDARRRKFLMGVRVHQLLASHVDAAVRRAVVPFYWATLLPSNNEGVTWTGRGSPINWESLSMKDRGRAVEQLWEGAAAMHRAGVVHHDIKRDNIVRHQNRFKFIDFDNSKIESGIGSFEMARHITFRCPENVWTADLPDASLYATDVFVLAVTSCNILLGLNSAAAKGGNLLERMWNAPQNPIAPNANTTFAAALPALRAEIVTMVNRACQHDASFAPFVRPLLRALAVVPADRASAADVYQFILTEQADALNDSAIVADD